MKTSKITQIKEVSDREDLSNLILEKQEAEEQCEKYKLSAKIILSENALLREKLSEEGRWQSIAEKREEELNDLLKKHEIQLKRIKTRGINKNKKELTQLKEVNRNLVVHSRALQERLFKKTLFYKIRIFLKNKLRIKI